MQPLLALRSPSMALVMAGGGCALLAAGWLWGAEPGGSGGAQEGPVSLTTPLEPLEPISPMLPEGMDAEPAAEPVLGARRRWTFSLESHAFYDDNILLAPAGQKQDDFVFLLTPSVTFARGDTLNRRGTFALLRYRPSVSVFAEDTDETRFNHDVVIAAQRRLGKFAGGIEARYQYLSGATPELSDRVDRHDASVKLNASYDISADTSIDATLFGNMVAFDEPGFTDYNEVNGQLFASHRLSGDVRVGAGGVLGRLMVDGQPDQDYGRALVKVTNDATATIQLRASGGVEYRRTGAGDRTTPVADITAEFRPTERTAVTLAGFRDVGASGILAGENITRTGTNLRVDQRLGSRLGAGLEAGYELLEYTAAGRAATFSGRSDDYWFVRPSVRYEFHEGRRAEIYCFLREDDSSLEEFSFRARQMGVALGFDF